MGRLGKTNAIMPNVCQSVLHADKQLNSSHGYKLNLAHSNQICHHHVLNTPARRPVFSERNRDDLICPESGSEACAETLTAECSGCCVLLPAEGFGMALRVKKTKSRGKAAYRTLYSLVYESDLFYPPGGKRDPDPFEWIYNKRCEIFFLLAGDMTNLAKS